MFFCCCSGLNVFVVDDPLINQSWQLNEHCVTHDGAWEEILQYTLVEITDLQFDYIIGIMTSILGVYA